jgi:hypothetical protein
MPRRLRFDFSRRRRGREADRRLGLVVPGPIPVIYGVKDGSRVVVFDEIAAIEYADWMRGREIIEFDDSEEGQEKEPQFRTW